MILQRLFTEISGWFSLFNLQKQLIRHRTRHSNFSILILRLKIFNLCAICLFDAVYSKQRLNIRVGQIGIGLYRSFVKHPLDFV